MELKTGLSFFLPVLNTKYPETRYWLSICQPGLDPMPLKDKETGTKNAGKYPASLKFIEVKSTDSYITQLPENGSLSALPFRSCFS